MGNVPVSALEKFGELLAKYGPTLIEAAIMIAENASEEDMAPDEYAKRAIARMQGEQDVTADWNDAIRKRSK
jgi:hypothetical protein